MVGLSESGLWLLAQVREVPPVPVWGAIWQTLLVVLISFGVLVAVMSVLRYQTMVKAAESRTDAGLDREGVRLLLMERLRRGGTCLVLFRFGMEAEKGLNLLRASVRRGDEIWDWEGMGAVMLFRGDDAANAAGAGRRLGLVLEEVIPAGVVTAALSLPGGRSGLLEKVDGLLRELTEGAIPDSGWSLPEVAKGETGAVVSDAQVLDAVTGVLRAERVPTAVQKILAGHRRLATPVCLVLAGLDDAETYAGVEGVNDAVLRAAAAELMATCRETDLVGRVSEDTFVVVMAGAVGEIEAAVRRMLEAVREVEVREGEQGYRFTLSAGVAGLPEHGAGPGALFAACQEALKMARERGRGFVQVYEPAVRTAQDRRAVPAASADSF